MDRQKTILIFIVLVSTSFILCGYAEKVFARNGSNGGSSAPTVRHIQPNVHPPPMPPGFPYKWGGKDLIKRFTEDGLEIEKAKPVAEVDYGKLPAKVKEITKFSIPSFGEDKVGYIFCFERRKNLGKVKNHYLELNKKGELYTWSFVKDNVLLLLSGAIPEEKARQYESALYNLKRHE